MVDKLQITGHQDNQHINSQDLANMGAQIYKIPLHTTCMHSAE